MKTERGRRGGGGKKVEGNGIASHFMHNRRKKGGGGKEQSVSSDGKIKLWLIYFGRGGERKKGKVSEFLNTWGD